MSETDKTKSVTPRLEFTFFNSHQEALIEVMTDGSVYFKGKLIGSDTEIFRALQGWALDFNKARDEEKSADWWKGNKS